jgi:hypothetical protein
LNSYIAQSGIKKQNENFSLNEKQDIKQLENLVFYLKEYIKSHLFN